MRRVKISDVSFEDVIDAKYDWLIVGVGVESRCDYISKCLQKTGTTVRNVLAFCFPDVENTSRGRIIKGKVKRSLEKVCIRPRNVHIVEIASDASDEVYSQLNKWIRSQDGNSLFVDYSAMSRVWYTSILLWLYHGVRVCESLKMVLAYAEGKYSKTIAHKDVAIQEIKAVPGCEGVIYRQAPTSVVFGLGFYGYASLCACEQLEPDKIYTLMTTDKPVRGFDIEEQDGNKEMIRRSGNDVYKVPLISLESTYRCLIKIAAQCHAEGNDVILVPMGPKPHVLASVLVSLSDRRVCTMRVRHSRYDSDIKQTGRIVTTKVSFVDVGVADGAKIVPRTQVLRDRSL